jgi:hypothetical protein
MLVTEKLVQKARVTFFFFNLVIGEYYISPSSELLAGSNSGKYSTFSCIVLWVM